MPGEGGPKNGTAAALLILWITAAYNQLTVNLEGPTQQWMSRHYPSYRSLEVFQEPQEPRRCSEELLGELWLDVANSTTARYRCPSVVSLMSFSTREAVYFKFAAMRAPRLRINLLHSLHTILQYVHLPRQGPIGLDRSLQCLDRTNFRISRDRHQRDSYGPLAFLRPHNRHNAHVLQTYRPARSAGNQSIGFSSSPAFDSIERTMAVLTRYSSSTPFSFRKENYVTLQQENEGAFLRSLLTLLNVHLASSSCTRQHFDGYRAITSIPTNRARISVVIACAAASDSPSSMRWEKDTAVTPLLEAQCRTSTHPTCSQAELDVLHTDTYSTLDGYRAVTSIPTNRARISVVIAYAAASDSPCSMRWEKDTAVTPPMGAQCRTSAHPTCSQAELDVLPTDTNLTLMHRGRDTAVTPLLGAHGRTSTHPTHSQVEPAALSTASMGALCRTSTHPTCSQTEPDVLPTDSLRDAQMLALAPALPNAHVTSTALSPTRAAADGKP